MIRIGWGHYSIGGKGGVNTVIRRNVEYMLELYDDVHITLFGEMDESIDSFMDFSHPRLSYMDMPILSPAHSVGERPVSEQDYHDYRWMGAQIEREMIRLINNFDIVFFENSTVGNNPAVNIALSLFTQGALSYTPDQRFIFRAHDFLFDRPSNFENMKKLRDRRNDLVLDWHPLTFPNHPNIHYVSINTNDAMRLYENGVSPERIHYLPNSVNRPGQGQEPMPNELRSLLESKGLVEKGDKILLYPIRIAPRKNVEEALLLTVLFNCLANPEAKVRDKFRTEGKYRLLISLDTKTGKFKGYSDHIRSFIEEHNLPVVLGLGDYVSLNRTYNDDGSVHNYGVSDLYSMADIVITTSILEGFGMVFIEPWLLGKPLIGRDLFVTQDFREAGMRLEHLYHSLLVGDTDFPHIGCPRDSIIYVASNEYNPEELDCRLKFVKRLLGNGNVLKRFTEDNYLAINATLSMLRASQNYLDHNHETVSREYSNEAVARKLNRIIRTVLESK